MPSIVGEWNLRALLETPPNAPPSRGPGYKPINMDSLAIRPDRRGVHLDSLRDVDS